MQFDSAVGATWANISLDGMFRQGVHLAACIQRLMCALFYQFLSCPLSLSNTRAFCGPSIYPSGLTGATSFLSFFPCDRMWILERNVVYQTNVASTSWGGTDRQPDTHSHLVSLCNSLLKRAFITPVFPDPEATWFLFTACSYQRVVIFVVEDADHSGIAQSSVTRFMVSCVFSPCCLTEIPYTSRG